MARLMRLSNRLRVTEPYAVEIYLVLCSLWASWALWNPPSNFSAYRGSYLWLASVEPNEQIWATVVFTGAMLKTAGLLCCLWLRENGVGISLRVVGLGVSGFFWVAFGGSAIAGNPDTLTATPMLLMGLSAWWTLFRFPAMPRP